MPEPVFAQAERRSFLVPILLALAAIAAALLIAIHFFPATTINAEHIHTDVLAKQTTLKSNTIVVGPGQKEDTLLIASTIKVDNLTRTTIYLDGFDLTFANPDDAQLTAKALTKDELANAELSFPDLKPLVTTPLNRDAAIEPGKSAQGTIVFALPIPKTMWDARKVATIEIEIYHQSPVFQDISQELTMRRRWIADTFTPESGHPTHAALTGDQAAHLSRVLRAEPGQIFDVVAAGFLHRAEITAVSPGRVDFVLHEELESDAALPLHLYLAIFKFDRLEWAIEKATELGVARITPIIAHRTEKHLAQAAAKRVERWRRIAHEASQQSRRTSVPTISDPSPLKPALEREQSPTRILLSETEQFLTLSSALAAPNLAPEMWDRTTSKSDGNPTETHAIAIGPEGGWTPEEMQLFTHHQWTHVTLGPRILRAETAAIAAMAIAGTVIPSPLQNVAKYSKD